MPLTPVRSHDHGAQPNDSGPLMVAVHVSGVRQRLVHVDRRAGSRSAEDRRARVGADPVAFRRGPPVVHRTRSPTRAVDPWSSARWRKASTPAVALPVTTGLIGWFAPLPGVSAVAFPVVDVVLGRGPTGAAGVRA